MSRKSTPDVLGEVMGSKPENNNPIKHVSNKVVDTSNNKKIKNVSNNTVKKPGNKITIQDWNNVLQQEGSKEKATFNLTVETLDLLEEAWINLRKTKREAKITKSLIVEKALRSMLGNHNL